MGLRSANNDTWFRGQNRDGKERGEEMEKRCHDYASDGDHQERKANAARAEKVSSPCADVRMPKHRDLRGHGAACCFGKEGRPRMWLGDADGEERADLWK